MKQQRSHDFELQCIQCSGKIPFTIDEALEQVICTQCGQEYTFSETGLKGQLRKFSNLCRALIDAEEILGNTSVGVNVGDREVKIPYKLLLTRLNTILDLEIGKKKLKITRRIEPLSFQK